MNKLDYLIVAERAGWHLLDFSPAKEEFIAQFMFDLHRPAILDAVRTYTSFKDWIGLREVIRLDQRAVQEELEDCLIQASELTIDMDVYVCAAYVDVNEYAQVCFERLAAYVDTFCHSDNEVLDEDT